MLANCPSMGRLAFDFGIVSPGVDGPLTETGFSVHNANEKLRWYHAVQGVDDLPYGDLER